MSKLTLRRRPAAAQAPAAAPRRAESTGARSSRSPTRSTSTPPGSPRHWWCCSPLVTLLTGSGWGLAVIAAGFWLRVLFGPRISPFGAALGQGPDAAAGQDNGWSPDRRSASRRASVPPCPRPRALLFAGGPGPGRLDPAGGADRGRLARGLRRLLPRLRRSSASCSAAASSPRTSARPATTFRSGARNRRQPRGHAPDDLRGLQRLQPVRRQAVLAVERAQDVARQSTRWSRCRRCGSRPRRSPPGSAPPGCAAAAVGSGAVASTA